MGKFDLVESLGILSVDTVWCIIFVVCSILFLLKEKQGKYILSIFLIDWAIIQYTSHWNYTIFGATERKLKGYNEYFANTYNIILHILIISLLILIMVIYFKKET
ncbi:hypothetical protein Clopa_1355 [Clostridium pasteurianum BC1]|uniref:Uncharacterized protein n=1 Tax=Clostridium pasteurianum BC1 TaxID=86416 RepID=R4JZS1_CLOPA|nr:hypothetical protein Clopa_1355 [Clostridium pasteurianum BC1]